MELGGVGVGALLRVLQVSASAGLCAHKEYTPSPRHRYRAGNIQEAFEGQISTTANVQSQISAVL